MPQGREIFPLLTVEENLQIGDTIRLLRGEGKMRILLVEQCLDFAKDLADIFYILDPGAVVAHGPVAELTDSVVKQHLSV